MKLVGDIVVGINFLKEVSLVNYFYDDLFRKTCEI